MWLAQRGRELQPHARAGPEDARGRDRAGASATATRASAPRRRSGCTTRTASRSISRSSWPASAASAWTSRASRSSWRSSASGRARTRGREGGEDAREKLRTFASCAGAPSKFTGYETTEQATAVASVTVEDGRVLAKLVESPFYATGGGQVHDGGVIECEDGGCSARVVDVVRLGDDQALVLEPLTGELHDGERVWARVDRHARRATECNHTATHLLHAALRERLGTPRPPGRLLRRPGQAALRLHARRAVERRGPRVGRGPRERA